MNNTNRRQGALDVRVAAAELAEKRAHPKHHRNNDELKFRTTKEDKCTGELKATASYLASYTKGLEHCHKLGLVKTPDDYQKFILGINSGDPRDFRETPLGPQRNAAGEPIWKSHKAKKINASVRAWESQGAGNTYDLEGPDAQAVTMPPAPELGSDELTAEMAEVYAQALLRDVPFTLIRDDLSAKETAQVKSCNEKVDVKKVLHALKKLDWFNQDQCCDLSDAENQRRRTNLNNQTYFRGITKGDDVGPYISQFLLIGNKGVNGRDDNRAPEAGLISYGSTRIDQRVRTAKPCEDHLQNWHEWFDVQNGADLRGHENYLKGAHDHRFITTPRDLATYVHYDALYQAYLNACLIMLGNNVPLDPGIPFQSQDQDDHQQGFAHFGGPHILSLVTEVATRALKAVRFQKFNVHRRARPEVLAARLAQYKKLAKQAPELGDMVAANGMSHILKMITAVNPKDAKTDANYLLPMAFCEGSPMHPSYGAGHATVAGACVTILKAFFDHGHELDCFYVPTPDGKTLKQFKCDGVPTVEGELNKLASNIAIGRDWAGVHYFTDYIESIRMGEQIAIGILEEQKLTFRENFSMTVPLYGGGSVRI